MDGKTPWTKGPWSVEEEKTGISVIADDTGEPVCRIAEWAPHVDRADARLIAAAPALAEALEGLLSHYVALARSGCWNPEEERPAPHSRVRRERRE